MPKGKRKPYEGKPLSLDSSSEGFDLNTNELIEGTFV